MHLMVTVLGNSINKEKPELYPYFYVNPETNEKTETKASLAPLALLDIFKNIPEKKPDKVLALCTETRNGKQGAMETTFPVLQKEMQEKFGYSEYDIIPGLISGNESLKDFVSRISNEIKKIFNQVSCKTPCLSVDFTHGFRQLTVMTYSTVIYLSELNKYKFCGAYVCSLGEGQVYDLSHLSTMQNWIHAIRRFETEMDISEIANLIDINNVQNKRIKKNLENFSSSFGLGLPIEAGYQANIFLTELKKQLKKHLKEMSLPEADILYEKIAKVLEKVQLKIDKNNGEWKKHIKLNKLELLRQAEVITNMLNYNRIAEAIGLMREWVISWVILQTGESISEWLDYEKSRKKAERWLSRLNDFISNKRKEEKYHPYTELDKFWCELRELRNAFQHCGMRTSFLQDRGTDKKIKNIRVYWEKTMLNCPDINLNIFEQKKYSRILITPIGLNKQKVIDTIFTLKSRGEEPDFCYFLVSEQSQIFLDEIQEKTQFSEKSTILTMINAFGGKAPEEAQKITERTKFLRSDAEEIFIGINCGTPFMQLCMTKIADICLQEKDVLTRRILIQSMKTPENNDEPTCTIFEV